MTEPPHPPHPADTPTLATPIDDLEALRGLFLNGRHEAFRERAARVPPELFSRDARAASLGLVHRALRLKTSGPELETETEALLADAEAAQARSDLDSESLSEIGLALLMARAIEPARVALERALTLAPVSAYAHFRAGTLAALEERLEEAAGSAGRRTGADARARRGLGQSGPCAPAPRRSRSGP